MDQLRRAIAAFAQPFPPPVNAYQAEHYLNVAAALRDYAARVPTGTIASFLTWSKDRLASEWGGPAKRLVAAQTRAKLERIAAGADNLSPA